MNFGISPRAIITDEQGRILVMQRHPSSDFWPSLWELPGGKMDEGETFDQTLVRETKEEVGYDIEPTNLVGSSEFDLPHVRVVVLVMQAKIIGGEEQLSDEHIALKWVRRDELNGLQMVPPIAEAIKGWLASTP